MEEGKGGGGLGVEGFALSAGLVLPAPEGRTVHFNGLKCRTEDTAHKGNLFQASGICKPG